MKIFKIVRNLFLVIGFIFIIYCFCNYMSNELQKYETPATTANIEYDNSVYRVSTDTPYSLKVEKIK